MTALRPKRAIEVPNFVFKKEKRSVNHGHALSKLGKASTLDWFIFRTVVIRFELMMWVKPQFVVISVIIIFGRK